ncbi:MAG: hypothetical protein AAF511_08475 [Pseudomonadota bacterium]
MLSAFMGGLSGVLRIGGGAVIGAVITFAWISLFTIPKAEQRGFDQCQAKVDKEHQIELERQRAANASASEQAAKQVARLEREADDLNEQLLDLANAVTASDGADGVCLGADLVRRLDAIR